MLVELDDGKGRPFELPQHLSLTEDGRIRRVTVTVTNNERFAAAVEALLGERGGTGP